MKFNKLVVYGISESSLDPEYWKSLDAMADKRVMVPKDDPAISTEMSDAEALLVNFGMVVDQTMLDQAPQLKYIGIMATAFNKVDVAYAQTRGIVVSNLGGYSTESVAEFVIAALLGHLRQLEKGMRQGREGNYSFEGFNAREIKGKIFGIVGLGQIGGRVGELAQGFDASINYWGREADPEAEARSMQFVDLDMLVSQADYISINLALNETTAGIFNRERIMKLKPGAIVVNTAPMELIDLDALAERIGQGDLVFIFDHTDEMSAEDLNKIRHPNCIFYPPIAFLTDEARTNKQETLVGNIQGFLAGKPQNIVS